MKVYLDWFTNYKGTIVLKSYQVRSNTAEEYKFIYLFWSLDKSKIVVPEESKTEIDKIILNEEKDILYGNVNIFCLKYASNIFHIIFFRFI